MHVLSMKSHPLIRPGQDLPLSPERLAIGVRGGMVLPRWSHVGERTAHLSSVKQVPGSAQTDLLRSALGRITATTVRNMNRILIHRALPASMLWAILVSVPAALAELRTPAGDWPQFQGPNRDGKSTERTSP